MFQNLSAGIIHPSFTNLFDFFRKNTLRNSALYIGILDSLFFVRWHERDERITREGSQGGSNASYRPDLLHSMYWLVCLK